MYLPLICDTENEMHMIKFLIAGVGLVVKNISISLHYDSQSKPILFQQHISA